MGFSLTITRILALLGSSLYWAWYLAAFITWSVFPFNVFDTSFSNLTYMVSQASAIIGVGFLVLLYKKKNVSLSPWFIVLSAIVLTVSTINHSAQTIDALSTTALFSGFIMGVCMAPLGIAWGARYTLEGSKSGMFVALSFFLASILVLAVSIMPQELQSLIVSLFLICSAFIWLYDLRYRNQNEKAKKAEDRKLNETTEGEFSLKLIPWKLLSIFIVASIMSELLTATMAISISPVKDTLNPYAAIQQIIFCCILLVVIWINKNSLDFRNIYIALAPIFTSILLLLLLLDMSPPQIFIGILRQVLYLLQILVWIYLIDTTRKESISPILSLGFATVVICSIILIGNVGSRILLSVFGVSNFLCMSLAAIEVIVLVIMTSLLARNAINNSKKEFPEAKRHDAPYLNNANFNYENLIPEKLALFSEKYKLSPREQEVFSLLTRGYSGPNIAEYLFVTSGTVKTHLSHIYKKLEIGSRKEAIDLFEDFSY